MSDMHKQELISNFIGLIDQANAVPSILFKGNVDHEVAGVASHTLDEFRMMAVEYGVCLSLPQTMCNSQALQLDLDKIEKRFPELVAEAKSLKFSPSRKGFLEMLEDSDELHQAIEKMAPTEANMLLDIQERVSMASLAPIFNFPSGIQEQEIRTVMYDMSVLIEAYKETWESVYHNIPDEDDDPEDIDVDPYDDHDRTGFYGALEWLESMVEQIGYNADRPMYTVEIPDLKQVGVVNPKPPRSSLN